MCTCQPVDVAHLAFNFICYTGLSNSTDSTKVAPIYIEEIINARTLCGMIAVQGKNSIGH